MGKGIFLIYLFFSILITGYIPKAGNSQTNQLLDTSFYRGDTQHASVDIYAISTPKDGMINLTSSDNYYDLQTDETDISVSLYFDLTGYSSWQFDNAKIDLPDDSTLFIDINHTVTVGQVYVIVDGDISLIHHASLKDGHLIPMFLGFHTISVLYLNYHPLEGVIYAYDTI
ncbi:MAG: hypothetical protein ACXAD7_24875, partial [Candidatus Kariarchaeaceae archaeon]